jgi:molybdate transport system substrate-binding protein
MSSRPSMFRARRPWSRACPAHRAISASGGTARFAQLLLILCLLPRPTQAAEVLAAVATNFAEPMRDLAMRFESETPHTVRITTGSTGKLYAQIRAGAPFDVLLAADQQRPCRLEAEGMAVPGSRFTYALGSIVLFSADASKLSGDGAALLRAGSFRRLAIANPGLAPYGVAAQQALEALGVWSNLEPRIVMGENIGQVYAMVATGNAELGIVAKSQLVNLPLAPTGSTWEIPQTLYAPIRQDAVLLKRAADNEAARALVRFLRRQDIQRVVQSFGYASDAETAAPDRR